MADRTVETSKKVASGRQIQAAIQFYNEGRFECAITLAHAAENMNAKLGLLSFFDKLKEKMSGEDHNLFANWLKHPTGPDTATISDLEVVVMIERAISKFYARFEFITEAMHAFQDQQRNKLTTS